MTNTHNHVVSVCLFLSSILQDIQALECDCPFEMGAYGNSDPGFADLSSTHLTIGRETIYPSSVGITVYILNTPTCNIHEASVHVFNTYWEYSASPQFIDLMDGLEANTTVFLFTEDEFTYRLSSAAEALLVVMGSPEPAPEYRSSLAMVTVANGDGTFHVKGSQYKVNGNGPSSLNGLIQTGTSLNENQQVNQFKLYQANAEPTGPHWNLLTSHSSNSEGECATTCISTPDCHTFVFAPNSALSCVLYSCAPVQTIAATESLIFTVTALNVDLMDVTVVN